MKLPKHHYAFSALGLRNSLKRREYFRKYKPYGWRDRVRNLSNVIKKYRNMLSEIAPYLSEEQRKEAYYRLISDLSLKKWTLIHNGEVVGIRVEMESGEREDLPPGEFLSSIPCSGYVKISEKTKKDLDQWEQLLTASTDQ